jgi:ParB/RepB/Spo0J family partition protein
MSKKTRVTDIDDDAEKPDELVSIPPGDLKPSPFHRRTVWGNMRAFASLIETMGVIEPPIVRIVDGEYELVVGHRRQKGAVMAKLETVPCLVRTLLDEEVIEIQAAENMRREDLHPLDACDYYAMLLERGHDQRSLGKRFGVQPESVRETLRLLSLAPMARAAYAKGSISHVAARYLCQLMPAQQGALTEALTGGAIADDAILAWIRRHALVSLTDVPWSLTDKRFSAGACATCPKRTGGGQRTLFAEIAGDDATCADPSCWKDKMRTVAAEAIEKAKADGHAISADKPDRTFIVTGVGRPQVIRSSGFVDADAECPATPGKTWLEAIQRAGVEAKITVHLDQDGRARYLLPEADVTGRVRRAVRDESTPIAKDVATADPARAAAKEAAKSAAKAEAALIAAALAGTITESQGLAIALDVVSMSSIRAVAKADGVEPDAIGAAATPAAGRRLVALMIAESGIKSTAVRDAARAAGISLPDVE